LHEDFKTEKVTIEEELEKEEDEDVKDHAVEILEEAEGFL